MHAAIVRATRTGTTTTDKGKSSHPVHKESVRVPPVCAVRKGNDFRGMTGADIRMLHARIGNQRVVQLLSGKAHMESHRGERTGGLPHALKVGAEALSGLNLDSVRVHYDSPKPEKLNALAYAQGSEIHLGPGQEKHLAHEAWHIVQQAEGRVTPNGSVKGQPLNDEKRLEQEAHTMGERALHNVAAPSASVSNNVRQTLLENPKAGDDSHPIQRKLVSYTTDDSKTNKEIRKDYGGEMDALAKEIDAAVQLARKQALQWNQCQDGKGGYLDQWAAKAKQYSANPTGKTDFLHSAFGYAIEQLASDRIKGKHGKLFVELQQTYGMTRPDIVVSESTGLKREVAWLDITSEGSTGHISNKTGAGWQNRPFVYEIVYPALNPKELLSSEDPYYEELGKISRKRVSMEEAETTKVRKKLKRSLTKFQNDNQWSDTTGNKTNKRADTRSFLEQDLSMDLGNTPMQATKGALLQLGFNPGHFGFTGKDSSETSTVKRWEEEVAEPEIRKKRILEDKKDLNKILVSNELKQKIPLTKAFTGSFLKKEKDMGKQISTGLMIKHAILRSDELKPFLPKGGKGALTQSEINAQDRILNFPKTVKKLNEWFPTTSLVVTANNQLQELQTFSSAKVTGDQKKIKALKKDIAKHIAKMPDTSDDDELNSWVIQSGYLINQAKAF